MTDEHEKLIEASSLGTPAAKKLRARTSDEDVAKVIDAGKPCPQCEHPFDSHAMVAIFEDTMDGGVIICPTRGCACQSTWSVSPRPKPELPPQWELDQIRAQVQDPTLP
jgi:hypothetical protein